MTECEKIQKIISMEDYGEYLNEVLYQIEEDLCANNDITPLI